MHSKPPLSIREKTIALVGSLTLAYTAWGFGGVLAWSLHIMLAGGLLTFLLAVLPCLSGRRGAGSTSTSPGQSRERGAGGEEPRARHKKQTTRPTTQAPAARIPRLLTFPGTCFAAAFLLYLALAALNPAWQIVSDARGWWLEPMTPPLASWLPTSVEAPYEPMNAWRIFNMHLAAFSLALGLYLGLSSRRATFFVLWSFLASTALMAAIAILQKYSGAGAVLWWLPSENRNFWGSFFYRNQGAAFLNWGIVIAGTLYFYHARRCREEARSGGPHFLAFCLIGLIAVSVGLALSRGGILFAAVLVAVFLLLVIVDYALSTLRSPPAIVIPLTATLALLLFLGLYQAQNAVDWQAVDERFGDIEATIENADRDARVLSSKLTWEMAQDALWTGWGAGSFRYAFPMYQQKFPELFYQYHHRKKGWTGRKFYRYAHNDILQFLAEYGIVGCSLLLLSVLSFFFSGFRWRLASLWLVVGLSCVAAHAFFDFIFHSPSYWVALLAGIALASRLSQLEARRG